MKNVLTELVIEALERLHARGLMRTPPARERVQLERSRDARHGDFACNIALVLAKELGLKPRDLAEQLLAAMPACDRVERIEVAGPGFINFHLTADAIAGVIRSILQDGADFGRSALGAGRRIQVEFVSANPTGPLHIGHGRHAAYGAAVANLLEAAGYTVEREYYVNDAGRQMDILALSVWIRYLALLGVQAELPASGYRGEYVIDIARRLMERDGAAYKVAAQRLACQGASDDPDQLLDACIANAKQVLKPEGFHRIHELALAFVLDSIRRDLEAFGVHHDNWFSEQSLSRAGDIERVLERLSGAGCIYERDGAKWFRSTDFGDEKDRVVIRENGQPTYFAADIAYHVNKFERGFEHVIDVWGADHHGYIARVKAAIAALGVDPQHLEVRLVQFATLYRGSERVQMSTRSGEFVTLAQLCDEVGRDAARFFYVMRKSEQHLDFDLELAKSQTSDNPMYYIQYAHARIVSVFRQLQRRGLSWNADRGQACLDRLVEEQEQSLIANLNRYPDVIETAGTAREPHQLVHYLRELANDFHVYYNAQKIIVDEASLRDARLSLLAACRQVFASGLKLLGVNAPDQM